MPNGVNFVLESGISLALLSLIYILFLRRETFFRLNRIFLIGSLVFSVILPFMKFRIYDPQPILLTEITVTPYRNLIEAVTVYGKDLSGTLEHVILSDRAIVYLYLAVALFFLLRIVLRMGQIYYMVLKNPVENRGDYKLVLVKKNIGSFSFMNYIFMDHKLIGTKGFSGMIIHETEHVKQGHSIDVVLIEVLTAMQWFNPFMWMLRRVIRENHEYLADQAVIRSGINFAQYKKLLLSQHVGGKLVLTSNFNYSLIKSRLYMLSRIRSSKIANMKPVLGFIIALGLVIAFACEKKEIADYPLMNKSESVKLTVMEGKLKIEGSFEELEKIKAMFTDNMEFDLGVDSLGNLELVKREKDVFDPEKEKVYSVVDEMPEFPGGEMAIRQFISENIDYPDDAVKNNVQGKVFVSFIIDRKGKVRNSRIIQGVDPSVDQEAVRVISALPVWKPGRMNGKPVNVSYTVPINFQLQ